MIPPLYPFTVLPWNGRSVPACLVHRKKNKRGGGGASKRQPRNRERLARPALGKKSTSGTSGLVKVLRTLYNSRVLAASGRTQPGVSLARTGASYLLVHTESGGPQFLPRIASQGHKRKRTVKSADDAKVRQTRERARSLRSTTATAPACVRVHRSRGEMHAQRQTYDASTHIQSEGSRSLAFGGPSLFLHPSQKDIRIGIYIYSFVTYIRSIFFFRVLHGGMLRHFKTSPHRRRLHPGLFVTGENETLGLGVYTAPPPCVFLPFVVVPPPPPPSSPAPLPSPPLFVQIA